MDEILQLGALELAEKIRKKKYSPLEVTETYIAQVKKINPKINALVEENFEKATAEAIKKTDDLNKNPEVAEKQKLYGVTFTVKEMISVNGFLQTAGNIHHKNNRRDFTSPIVQRTLDEGAILLGTSNVPELGFWFETRNAVYGTTSNPYNYKKTAGGSSGGESALIGSACSAFGLGSDVGGSIRIPAFFCGIFGHKSTNKTIPITGHFPHTPDSVSRMLTACYPITCMGPIARQAKDLNFLLRLYMKPDSWDKEVTKKDWLQEPRTSLKGLKVFICPDPIISFTRRADTELQDSVLKSGKYLEKLGAELIDFDQKFFTKALKLWGAGLRGEKDKTFENSASATQGLNLTKEFLNIFKGQARHTLPALATVLAERTLSKLSVDRGSFSYELDKVRNDLNEILGSDGVLILPPHSRVAPDHGWVMSTPFDFSYAGIFNALGSPATAVPIGLNAAGMPLGVQVVANHFHDHLTLGVAQVLETAFGGWVPPKIR